MTYDHPNGKTYEGDAAVFLNLVDSMEAAANDNWADLRYDQTFNDNELAEEIRLRDVLNYIIDNADDFAAYL